MSSMLISNDDFERMRAAMDKDGDGQIDKEEFKEAYKLVYNGSLKDFDETYDVVWTRIDKDGDGNLTVEELASFFGFDLTGEGNTDEMTDDQILQALSMAGELDAKRMKATGKSAAETEDPKMLAKKKAARDTTYKTLQIDKKILLGDRATDMVEAVALRACVQTIPGNAAKGAQLTDKNISDMVTMMELLGGAMINDLKNNKEDEEPTVFKLLNDSGLLVRMEDHNGETPLHKLARFTVPDDKIEMFTMIFHKFIMKMRDECKEAKKSLGDSINKQDAKGKTVMFQAIESKNIVLVQLLNTLGKDRPDSLIVTASGWSVLHQAVQTDHFETLKEVVAGLLADGGRLRVLINLKDKSGRQPLHIAAYRCEGTDIVEYLMENGANGRSTDASGLDPTHLAEKAGRRKSKEIIEEGVRKQPIGRGGRRMSKEVMEVLALNEPGGAVAPATATATPK